MDLLYHRYASPLNLLDMVISSGQLDEFVDVMIEQINEEKMWELYLHQIIKDKSFNSWRDSLMADTGEPEDGNLKTDPVSQCEINAAIQKSQVILENFIPE